MINGTLGGAYDERWQKGHKGNSYEPPLPTSVLKDEDKHYNSDLYGDIVRPDFKDRKGGSRYKPPLPTSVMKEGKSIYSDRPVERYKDHKGGSAYEPPLPTSVQEDKYLESIISKLFHPDIDDDYINEEDIPNSILTIKSQKGKHSTQKPVDLMKWVLKYYTKKNDIVLDNCMGSGSTGVACKEMNRNFIGIEMNDDIFEVACDRLLD
jgi:hypothetical protein